MSKQTVVIRNIKELLKQANLSNLRFTEITKIKYTSFNSIMNGTQKPSLEILQVVSEYFNVTIDSLLNDDSSELDSDNKNYTKISNDEIIRIKEENELLKEHIKYLRKELERIREDKMTLTDDEVEIAKKLLKDDKHLTDIIEEIVNKVKNKKS
ncbi:helix-turn-helix domain-containing protein [Aureivirga marina]|uniref:helix-turn-helix domain-containing protein n=1 Tax=Aureivirga marina TaxID=1182451 RepID=UPI0018C9DEE3|nr:helix-turn-helix transcriptional regulator [Aureivirga marina]